jgi:putative redox protein
LLIYSHLTRFSVFKRFCQIFTVTNFALLHLFTGSVIRPDASKSGATHKEPFMISARVSLTQPLKSQRQFVAESGSGHHFLLDDAAGATGPKPVELVAAALAGCTAFDVVTILRQKHHQNLTAYEVHVEADQAERPPQVFTAIRVRHVLTGFSIDKTAVEEAIRLSEEKYCSVGAMLKAAARTETTFEIHEEPTRGLQLAYAPERVTA